MSIPMIAGLYPYTRGGVARPPTVTLEEIPQSLEINPSYRRDLLVLAAMQARRSNWESFGLEVHRIFDDAPPEIHHDTAHKMKHWMCCWALETFGEFLWWTGHGVAAPAGRRLLGFLSTRRNAEVRSYPELLGDGELRGLLCEQGLARADETELCGRSPGAERRAALDFRVAHRRSHASEFWWASGSSTFGIGRLRCGGTEHLLCACQAPGLADDLRIRARE